jgi:hypothetical protein
MSVEKRNEEIKDAVKKELEGGDFAVSTLSPLTGGTANFIYLARLQKPLSGGVTEVVLKHGEAYVAQHPDFKLQMVRCVGIPVSKTLGNCVADASRMCPSDNRTLKKRACDSSQVFHPSSCHLTKLEPRSYTISILKLVLKSKSTYLTPSI